IPTDHRAFETSFPQGARTPIGIIKVPHIPSPDALHELSQGAVALRFHQKMKMVGHEDVGIESDPVFSFGLSKALQADLIILRGDKDGLPIVAALDHVMGISGKAETSGTGHGREISWANQRRNLPNCLDP